VRVRDCRVWVRVRVRVKVRCRFRVKIKVRVMVWVGVRVRIRVRVIGLKGVGYRIKGWGLLGYIGCGLEGAG
jgi:hypothetical protein